MVVGCQPYAPAAVTPRKWYSFLLEAKNRNEYQEYFLVGKGGWCIGLTTLPPSCANCPEICEPQPPGPSGPVQACHGIVLPFYFKDGVPRF